MNRLDRYGPRPERPGLHIGTKVLLILIALTMALFGALSFVGGRDAMLVYTWVQLGLPFITMVLVLALIVPGARRFARGETLKKVLTFITCAIVALAGLLVYSFIYTYTLVAPNPHSYHTSPDGKNQIVVMTYVNPDSLAEEEQQTFIVAFPMKNRLFFYDTSAEALYDDNMSYPSYAVEWLTDEEARVYLTSFTGEGRGELVVNMSDRRAIVADEDNAPDTPDETHTAPPDDNTTGE